jgi:hypothetical protein
VYAQTGNRGLIISPIVNDLDVEKSKSYSYDLELYNDANNYKYNIEISKQTFIPSATDGVPELVDPQPDNDYTTWLSFDESKFSIESGKKQVVQAKLTIPSDAKAGGYYFAIIFSNVPEDQNNLDAGVKIKDRIAALLFVNVQGQVEKSVKFSDIETNQKIYDPFFDKILLKYTLAVAGGTYIKPSGNIFLNDGSTAGVNLFSLNPNEKIILPNSSRTFNINNEPDLRMLWTQVQAQENMQKIDSSKENQADWQRLWFGNQKIEAKAIYVNSDGKIAQESTQTNIFYFPWKSLLILTAILGTLVFFTLKIRSLKRLT